MRLEIQPISRAADEVLFARLIDGPAEGEATVTVATADAGDHRRESWCVFRADVAATVDLSRDAPVSGSVTDRCISIRPDLVDAVRQRGSRALIFTAPRDQLELTFAAEVRGARTTATDHPDHRHLDRRCEAGRTPKVAPGRTRRRGRRSCGSWVSAWGNEPRKRSTTRLNLTVYRQVPPPPEASASPSRSRFALGRAVSRPSRLRRARTPRPAGP